MSAEAHPEDEQLRYRRPGDLRARQLNEQGDTAADDAKTPRSDDDDDDVDRMEQRQNSINYFLKLCNLD